MLPGSISRMYRKRLDTRRKIIRTAMDLFTQSGIDSVSMEQIAEKADIARGTLYNHFQVKEAIIAEYIESLSTELNTDRIERLRTLPDTRTRLQLSLHELMQGVRAQPELFERYFIYRTKQMVSLQPDESHEKGLRSLEKAIIQMGQESGELRLDIAPGILEALISFIFIETAQQFYASPENFNESDVIQTCIDLFLHGVTSN